MGGGGAVVVVVAVVVADDRVDAVAVLVDAVVRDLRRAGVDRHVVVVAVRDVGVRVVVVVEVLGAVVLAAVPVEVGGRVGRPAEVALLAGVHAIGHAVVVVVEVLLVGRVVLAAVLVVVGAGGGGPVQAARRALIRTVEHAVVVVVGVLGAGVSAAVGVVVGGRVGGEQVTRLAVVRTVEDAVVVVVGVLGVGVLTAVGVVVGGGVGGEQLPLLAGVRAVRDPVVVVVEVLLTGAVVLAAVGVVVGGRVGRPAEGARLAVVRTVEDPVVVVVGVLGAGVLAAVGVVVGARVGGPAQVALLAGVHAVRDAVVVVVEVLLTGAVVLAAVAVVVGGRGGGPAGGALVAVVAHVGHAVVVVVAVDAVGLGVALVVVELVHQRGVAVAVHPVAGLGSRRVDLGAVRGVGRVVQVVAVAVAADAGRLEVGAVLAGVVAVAVQVQVEAKLAPAVQVVVLVRGVAVDVPRARGAPIVAVERADARPGRDAEAPVGGRVVVRPGIAAQVRVQPLGEAAVGREGEVVGGGVPADAVQQQVADAGRHLAVARHADLDRVGVDQGEGAAPVVAGVGAHAGRQDGAVGRATQHRDLTDVEHHRAGHRPGVAAGAAVVEDPAVQLEFVTGQVLDLEPLVVGLAEVREGHDLGDRHRARRERLLVVDAVAVVVDRVGVKDGGVPVVELTRVDRVVLVLAVAGLVARRVRDALQIAGQPLVGVVVALGQVGVGRSAAVGLVGGVRRVVQDRGQRGAAVRVEAVADLRPVRVDQRRQRQVDGAVGAGIGGHLVQAVHLGALVEEAGVVQPGGDRAALDEAVAVGVVLFERRVGVLRVVDHRSQGRAAVGVQPVADLGGARVHLHADRAGDHRHAVGEVHGGLVQAVPDGVADVRDVGRRAGALQVGVLVGVVLFHRRVGVGGVPLVRRQRQRAVGVQPVAHLGGVRVDQHGHVQPHRGVAEVVEGDLVQAVPLQRHVEEAHVRQPAGGGLALQPQVAVGVVLLEGGVGVGAVPDGGRQGARAVGVQPVADLRRARVHLGAHHRGGHQRAGVRVDVVLVQAVPVAAGVVEAHLGQPVGGRVALQPAVQVGVVLLEGGVAVRGVIDDRGEGARAVGVQPVAQLDGVGVPGDRRVVGVHVEAHPGGAHRGAGLEVHRRLVQAVGGAVAHLQDVGGHRVTVGRVALQPQIDVGVVLLHRRVGVVGVVPVEGQRARAVGVQAVADLRRRRVDHRRHAQAHRLERLVVGGDLVQAVLVAVVVEVAHLVDPGGREVRARVALQPQVTVGVVLLEGRVAVVAVPDVGGQRGRAVGVQPVADLGGARVDVEAHLVGLHPGVGVLVPGQLVQAVVAAEAGHQRVGRGHRGALDEAVQVGVVLLEGRVGVVGVEGVLLAVAVDVAGGQRAAAVGVEAVADLRHARVDLRGAPGADELGRLEVGLGVVQAVVDAVAGHQRRLGLVALDPQVAVGVVLVQGGVELRRGVLVDDAVRRGVQVAGPGARAVGVEAVAHLGGAGVDHRLEVEVERLAGGPVVDVLVEAVAAAQDQLAVVVDLARVDPARALDVLVPVVVPLVGAGQREGPVGVGARAVVVPAVADAGVAAGVDVLHRLQRVERAGAAHVGADVGAVPAPDQVVVGLGRPGGPAVHRRVVDVGRGEVLALDVVVLVEVVLEVVDAHLRQEQLIGRDGGLPEVAVVVPAVADLGGLGVDREGGCLGVGRGAGVDVARRRQEVGRQLGAAVDAVHVAADRVAVAVGVQLVRAEDAVAQRPVAVVVQAVAQLRSAREGRRVQVVAVQVLGDPVAVGVDAAGLHRGRVAVVVDAAVDHLGRAGVDRRVVRLAVAADQAADLGGRPALDVAVAVAVDLGQGDEAVAVVVDPVADLLQEGGALIVVVVAVALGLGEAVSILVQLVAGAGVAGDAGQTGAADGGADAVLLVAAPVEARVGVEGEDVDGVVEAGIAGTLVVHQHQLEGPRGVVPLGVGVAELRRAGVDVGGVVAVEGLARVVVAVVPAGEADDAPVAHRPGRRLLGAGDEAVVVGIGLVRRHQAVAVVVLGVAQLGGAGHDRRVGVVAVVVGGARHAVRAALRHAVDVGVGLVLVEEAVAVVVDVVASLLFLPRVDQVVGVVAVGLQLPGRDDKDLRRALRVVVEVVVELDVGHAVDAVVVLAVAQLGGAAVDRVVGVVAVQRLALGGGVAQGAAVHVVVVVVRHLREVRADAADRVTTLGVAGGAPAAVAVVVQPVADLLGLRVDRGPQVVAVAGAGRAALGGRAAAVHGVDRHGRVDGEVHVEAEAVVVRVVPVGDQQVQVVAVVAVVVDLVGLEDRLADLGRLGVPAVQPVVAVVVLAAELVVGVVAVQAVSQELAQGLQSRRARSAGRGQVAPAVPVRVLHHGGLAVAVVVHLVVAHQGARVADLLHARVDVVAGVVAVAAGGLRAYAQQAVDVAVAVLVDVQAHRDAVGVALEDDLLMVAVAAFLQRLAPLEHDAGQVGPHHAAGAQELDLEVQPAVGVDLVVEGFVQNEGGGVDVEGRRLGTLEPDPELDLLGGRVADADVLLRWTIAPLLVLSRAVVGHAVVVHHDHGAPGELEVESVDVQNVVRVGTPGQEQHQQQGPADERTEATG